MSTIDRSAEEAPTATPAGKIRTGDKTLKVIKAAADTTTITTTTEEITTTTMAIIILETGTITTMGTAGIKVSTEEG